MVANEKSAFDILVIDDEHLVLLVASELLRLQGYQVLVALDMEGALHLLRENTVSLLLLDVKLGGVDSLELLRVLRRDHPTVPVILHTRLDQDAQQVDQMLDAGAACYLDKGEGPHAMIYAVREFLGKRVHSVR
jgi:DNA-binding response OmpR family regulator